MMRQHEYTFKHLLRTYFNLMPDKESEKEIVEDISQGVTFRGANLWVLIFAIFIASLGLNINSTAVIIGAMLISPLMGPIIGMGLSVGINDFELLKRSLKNYLISMIISIATASIYFLITPFDQVQSEILARTSPTIYDVLIAFCGGFAGIIALSTKGKGNVIPGVAIATALMPPLCTAGFGLATGHFLYFLGAFYLFFINSVFISLATFIGVRMMKFRNKTFVDMQRYKRVKKYIIIVIILTMIPACYITFNIIKESLFNNNVSQFIKNEFKHEGTQIIYHEIDNKNHLLKLVAVGKEIPKSAIEKAHNEMTRYHLNSYQLKVIQGNSSDSVLLSNIHLSNKENSYQEYAKTIQQQNDQINSLNQSLSYYKKYEKIAPSIQKELKVLYPNLINLEISQLYKVKQDSLPAQKQTIIIAEFTKGTRLSVRQRNVIENWISTRIQNKEIHLVTLSQ